MGAAGRGHSPPSSPELIRGLHERHGLACGVVFAVEYAPHFTYVLTVIYFPVERDRAMSWVAVRPMLTVPSGLIGRVYRAWRRTLAMSARTFALPRLAFLLVAFAVLLIPPSPASAASVEWVRQFGTAGEERTNGLAIDAAGAYVVGHQPRYWEGWEHRNAFVRRYDLRGNLKWTRSFGAADPETGLAADDRALDAAADPSGVYVLGTTSGRFPGYDTATVGPVFIRKYSPSGAVLWTRQLVYGVDAYGIAVDASGVYVTSYMGAALPGYTARGNWDSIVLKYSLDGDYLWGHQFGTSGADFAWDISARDGAAYVVGQTDGSFPGYTILHGNDGFIHKVDAASGKGLWTRQIGGMSDQQGRAVASDTSGVSMSVLTGDAGPDGTGPGAFIRRYDTSGRILWTREFERQGFEPVTMAADRGAIYVGGSGPGVQSEQRDAFVRKYTSGGAVVRTRLLGTVQADWAEEIAVDARGVYLAGQTLGAFPGFTYAGNVDGLGAFLDIVSPRGAVKINGGAASTATRGVKLTLSATDTASAVTHMRFRNVGTSTWSSWRTYATSSNWTLTSGAGTKTVYVQYRDAAGNISPMAQDSIRYSP